MKWKVPNGRSKNCRRTDCIFLFRQLFKYQKSIISPVTFPGIKHKPFQSCQPGKTTAMERLQKYKYKYLLLKIKYNFTLAWKLHNIRINIYIYSNMYMFIYIYIYIYTGSHENVKIRFVPHSKSLRLEKASPLF